MAINTCPSMPGSVFSDRQHAGGQQPVRHRSPKPSHDNRMGGERPVADDVMCTCDSDIQYWSGRDGEAGAVAVVPDQRTGQPDSAQPSRGIRREKLPNGLRRGMLPPMRLTQARHTAAFLVDHKVGVRGQYLTQRGDECRQLDRILNVAREQDDPSRWKGAKQSCFLRQQG